MICCQHAPNTPAVPMSTPLWQFWTDWGVKALGTLGTFAAVLVALFGERWRAIV
jgi:hypothetical protein